MFEIDDDADDFEIEDFRREVQARWTYHGQSSDVKTQYGK